MSGTKPWYLSRTIWASLVTIAMAIAGMAGLQVADIDSGALSESLLQAVTAISGLIAIFGRIVAASRIG